MPFWSDTAMKPKRNHKFLVYLGGLGSFENYTAMTVAKPTFNVSNHEHTFLTHKFYFPGYVTWDPVEMTFADAGGGSEAGNNATAFYNALLGSGYTQPVNAQAVNEGIVNKAGAVQALGSVKIQQVGFSSEDILDTFVLNNAWIEKVTFGALDYTNDAITQLNVAVRYDYATYSESEI